MYVYWLKIDKAKNAPKQENIANKKAMSPEKKKEKKERRVKNTEKQGKRVVFFKEYW